MTQIQLAEWEWPENPRFLMCTPLSHAGAAFFVPTVIKGGALYVLARFDPAEVLRTIEEQRITATMLVPSMLYALMDHPDSRTRDLSARWRPSTTAPRRSTRCGCRRRSTGSGRSSPSTTGSPRRRW